MEKGKIWSPKNGAMANMEPALIRIYYGEKFVERRWKSAAAHGYYDRHRQAKGEDLGDFTVTGWNDVPEPILNAARQMVTDTQDAWDGLIKIASYPRSYRDYIVFATGARGRKEREELAAADNAKIEELLGISSAATAPASEEKESA